MREKGEAGRPGASLGKALGLTALFTAPFLQQLDSTIVNVALPHMQGSLQASREQITWVLTSYIVSTALMMAPAGSISRLIGRKRLFQICVSGFTFSSMCCGLAQSLDQIVFFRFIQGAAGGGLVPIVFAIMIDNYEGHERNRMLAMFSSMANIGIITGPALGGFLTEFLGWRWTFFVNVPIGLAMVIGVGLFFEDTADKRKAQPFDVFGFVTLSLGVAALQLMFDRGPSVDWFSSREIILEAFIAVIGLYFFAVHMATAQIRFVPPALFHDRNFIIGTCCSTMNVGLTYASAALLPAYLQTLSGYSVLDTGLLLAPRGFSAIFAAFIGAQLVALFTPRLVLMLGWAITAWSLWEMAHWTPDVGAAALVIVSLAQGISQSFLGAVNNSVCFTTLPGHLTNDGTSISMLLRHVGAALFISLSATFLANNIQEMHEIVAASASPFNRGLSVGAPSLFWNLNIPAGAAQLDAAVSRNAAIVGYSNVFLLMFYFSFILPVLTLMIRTKPSGTVPSKAMEVPAE